MPDIKGQLIKNSYNYVLQSDLITGIVYRIGGDAPNNPKFISGLTVNANFTYSNGSEFPGYVLTCDSAGNAVWGPVSGATSGVVVTGGTFDYSAGTLTLGLSNGVNVPISGLEDIYVTGGVVSGNSIVFSYNDTNTFEVSGITSFDTFTSYTASTDQVLNSKVDINTFNAFAEQTDIDINNRVQIPTFTAYTATTQVQINNKLDTSGFTAYTASTQPLILNAVTGGTYSGGTLYLVTNSGNTVQITGFSSSSSSTFTGGTVTGPTNFTNGLTANTISATTYYNLPISAVTSGTGISATTNNGLVTIINTLPDQTVTITGGTNMEITGSYPNFGVNFTGTTGSNFTGGTVSGPTDFTNGLTANTISATTYYNLPVSGLTAGQNISISGSNGNFTISVTGITSSSNFTGGTVSGATNFTGGLTANTISATTYYNYPDTYVTGFTLSANTITLSQNRTDSYSSFTISLSAYTGSSVSGDYLPLSGGTLTGGTIFQSGLTANTISATTYYNLPTDVFVTGGTYTSGNVIFRNNAGGTFTVTGFAVGGGEGQPFYLNLSQSKNGNRYLSTTATTAAEQSTGVTIGNGATGTIASFQSDQLNITLIPGGVWAFYLHSYKSNSNASFNIFVEVYKRTSGGTETLLFTTDPTPVTTNSPNPSMQLSDGYFSGSPILISDSIVAKVRATNTSNQSHVITLFSEGTQHYSYAVSSIPTQQGLTCDTLSGCSIIQTIETNITNLNNNKFDKTGGTISGDTIFQSGLTADTIYATIYNNLPIPSLEQVNTVGNTTSLNIVFQNAAEAQFGSGGGILLANSARLREGTTDGLLGGAKGIAQICSNDYELKWEAGRLYVMEQDGFTIREVRYQFNVKPVGTDDVDKGYIVGSRWILDNGNLFVCSDNSQGLAVWEAQTICDELADCAVITGLTGDVQTIFSSITGTPNQVAYYNASGNLTGDTNFTRLDETNSYTTTINTVNFSNINEHQDTVYDFSRVRNRIYNDDISLVSVTLLESQSFLSKVENTSGGTISSLEILESSGSFTYQDSGGTYCGFFYNSTNPGWSIVRSGTQYDYNLPQSAYVAGSVLTDVSGDGNLTWVVPTSSTFTGGTVTGATNFTGGLTANTIFATNYLNLPTDIRTTGATYSSNTFTFTNNGTGGTFNVLFNTVTGLTVNGNVTVTGTTTTGTISATTYQNLPTYISAVTESANVITVVNSTGTTTSLVIDAVTGGTYSAGQITLSGTGNVNGTQISTKVLPIALTVVSNTASTDASLSSTFTLTLTGNTTLATPTNGFSGQRIVYRLRQDGTGNKLLTLSSGFRSGPITVALSTAANTTDYLGVIYNEIDNGWDVLALNKGYS